MKNRAFLFSTVVVGHTDRGNLLASHAIYHQFLLLFPTREKRLISAVDNLLSRRLSEMLLGFKIIKLNSEGKGLCAVPLFRMCRGL